MVSFDRVAIIGLGLIGSSLTRAITDKGQASSVFGFDGSEAVRAEARDIKGFGAEITDTLEEAVSNADLVIMAVPVGAVGALAEELCPYLKEGAILSDVGSVKKSIIDAVLPHLPETCYFVPGHPVAGTEYSGPKAGFSTLFEGRWCILTPLPNTPRSEVEKVSNLWAGLGSDVEEMDAEHHDIVLAITSHIPHLIAYNIVGTAADLEEVTSSEVIKYSAGGFRDFTRIAASDPVMWRDVFMNNKDAVLEMLGRFTEDLTQLQRHIRRGDAKALEDLFTRTREIRRSIVEAGQETEKPDFGR
ncbi:MAG: prephenate/arogenate dehydrogenase family protein [Rhizobiales bacterium]|nr:prephenate/arogenate dehydrogenase family protein [Hyphomicrobiales bacterium]